MVSAVLLVFGANQNLGGKHDEVFSCVGAATHFFRERIKAIAGVACIDINTE